MGFHSADVCLHYVTWFIALSLSFMFENLCYAIELEETDVFA